MTAAKNLREQALNKGYDILQAICGDKETPTHGYIVQAMANGVGSVTIPSHVSLRDFVDNHSRKFTNLVAQFGDKSITITFTL